MAEEDFDDVVQDAELVGVLREALRQAHAQLRLHRNRTDLLVQATQEAALSAVLAYGPIPLTVAPPKDKRHKTPEHALMHMTDFQGAKKTMTYNTQVMESRALAYVKKAVHLTEIQRAHHPVNDCTVMFGGDMVEGLFNFPTQPFEIDATIHDQYVTVGMLLVQLVRHLLLNFHHVTVFGEWGNHGRIGSKRSAVPKSDNFDRMVYTLARKILEPEIKAGRLSWEDCPEDIQRVTVGNYRALLMHGDEVGRNGFASPMTMVGYANKQASGSFRAGVEDEIWSFRDVYVGHYHTHQEFAMANGLGSVFYTGSIESSNRYARDTMAASALPTQRLHFIEPEEGYVTAQYKVYVDRKA